MPGRGDRAILNKAAAQRITAQCAARIRAVVERATSLLTSGGPRGTPSGDHGPIRKFSVARIVHCDLYLDSLDLENCGRIRALGWERSTGDDFARTFSLRVNRAAMDAPVVHRHARPDVPASHPLPTGFCLEWDVGSITVDSIELAHSGSPLFTVRGLGMKCTSPPFVHLRYTRDPCGRESIYGYGPPVPFVTEEIAVLARLLPPPILDFGCGMGAMIDHLRAVGLETFGIELQRPDIEQCLTASSRPYVKVYDGTWPTPFGDKSFESVVCSEVLEHIPDWRGALSEIVRVCRRDVLITVPDIEVIPVLHKHGVVPWHLLESTHVNFFTAKSLSLVLSRHFEQVRLFKCGTGTINGTQFWGTLIALCHGPR